MKILGRILFGLVVMFFGLSLFQCTQQSTFAEAIAYEADNAIKENDYTFFKSIFPQRAKTDLLNEVVEEETTSFNLNLYLVGSEANSSIIFLVDNYSKSPRPQSLKLFIQSNSKQDLQFDLVSLGKENWYLQWIHLDKLFEGQAFIEDVLDFQIKDDTVLLYDFDESTGPLIASNDANLQSYIKKENVAIAHAQTFINIADATLDETVSEKVTSTKHKQTFQVNLLEATNQDVYVIGNFNNYDVTDKKYKLTKGKGNDYKGTFDIETDDKDLYYYVLVGDKIISENNLAKQYQRTYVSKDTNLETLNIETITPIKLNKFQYKVWIVMIAYLAISGVMVWLLFFRKKKGHAQFKEPEPKQQPKPQENLNLKSITDVEERDSDLQVHESETIIEAETTEVEEVKPEVEDVASSVEDSKEE